MKTEKIIVEIRVTRDQVAKLEAILADLQGEDCQWTDWRVYADTVATIGFEERLETRYQQVIKKQQTEAASCLTK